MSALVIASVLLLLVAPAQVALAAGPHVISGRVTDANTGAGLQTFVQLHRADDCFGSISSVMSDAAGSYALTVASDGSYKIRYAVSVGAHAVEWNGDSPTCETAPAISLTADLVLDVQLQRPSYPLHGSITSYDTGAPVAGATVNVHSGPRNSNCCGTISGTTTTDALGNYSVPVLAQDWHWVEVQAPAGFVSKWYGEARPGVNWGALDGVPSLASTTIDIALASVTPSGAVRTAVIGNLLASNGGSPDRDIIVSAYRAGAGVLCCTTVMTTSGRASYIFGGLFRASYALPDGTYKFAYRSLDGSGYLPGWYGGTDYASAREVVIAAPPGVPDPGVVLDPVTLTAVTRVTGRSQTDGNLPLPGVTLVAYRLNAGNCCEEIARVTTGADAQFSLVLPRDVYRFLVLPPPGAYVTQWLANKADWTSAEAIDLRHGGDVPLLAHVQRGVRASGRVTEQGTGAPIAGVTVEAWNLQSSGAYMQTTTVTAADGTYSVVVPNIANNNYRFMFVPRPGHSPGQRTETFMFADRSGIDVALVPGYTLSGRVTDADTGAGLQTHVQLYRADDCFGSIASTTSDTQGTYGFTVAQAGGYRLRFAVVVGTHPVEWNGDAATCSAAPVIDIQADRVVNATLARPRYPLHGTVTSYDTGAPVAGATVVLHTGPRNSVCCGAVSGTTTTDAQGNYSIGALAQEWHWVEIQAPAGYVSQWYGGAQPGQNYGALDGSSSLVHTAINVQLASTVPAPLPRHFVAGRLSSPQLVSAIDTDIVVTAYRAGPGVLCCTAVRSTSGRALYSFGGSFAPDQGLPTGTYKFSYRPINGTGYRETWYGGGDFASAREVTVDRDMNLDDVVIDAITRLSGQITDRPSGPPLPGSTVIAYHLDAGVCCREAARSVADAEGRYALELFRGPYRLLVVAPPGPYVTQWYAWQGDWISADTLNLVAPQDHVFNIPLNRGITLSGRVTRLGSTQPIAGVTVRATVRFSDGSSRLTATTTTAADGTYSFVVESVGTNDYRLDFAPPPGYLPGSRVLGPTFADRSGIDIGLVGGNDPPVASAGADRTVPEGQTVTLDARGSTDADGDTLTYVWSRVTGPAVTLDGTDAAVRTFVATDDASYTFRVTVSDAQDSATDDIVVTIANVAPVISAPAMLGASEGAAARIAGSFTDPGADTWSATADPGDGSGPLPLALASDKTFSIDHRYAAVGRYTAVVTVTDDDGGTAVASITVDVANVAPAVSAGGDAALTEGGRLTRQGSFSDPGAGPWTATVDHGDGTGEQPLALAADKTFALDHRYVDDGAYVVTVTVNDGAGGSATARFRAIVSNAAPVASATGAASLSEGAAFAGSGSFTDPGADGWTATVDYGDGSGVQPLALAADRTFALAHNYRDDGTYTVVVSVTDDDGGSVIARHTVLVTNVAPLVSAGADAQLPEGSSFTRTGSFTDAGADIWTATVDYGDGTGPQPLPLAADKTFALAHSYTNDGLRTVTVTVSDGDGGIGTASFTVRVTDVAPQVTAGGDAALVEGATFVRAGSFADPGSDTWTATIDYGDGTGPQPLALAADKTFSLDHRYTDDGSFTVTVIVTDAAGASGRASFAVTVRNEAPAVLATGPASLNEGGTLTGSGSFGDPGADTWTATVDYGDGSGVQTLALAPDRSFSLAHTYANDGRFEVIVTVRDDDGGSGSSRFSVDVANVAPAIALGSGSTLAEGTPFRRNGSFTDPGADGWSATVDYGDGSGGQPLLLSADRTFVLAHTYDDDGERTVTVTVNDGTATSTARVTVVVTNVAPSADAGPDRSVPWGMPIALEGHWTDAGRADTHTSSWSVGGAVYPGFSIVTSFADPGEYDARFDVRDDDGGSGFDTARVTVTTRSSTISCVAISTAGAPLRATVRDAVDAATARLGGRSVTFTIAGSSFTALTAPDGSASVPAPLLAPGSYSLGVRVAADRLYDSATSICAVDIASTAGSVTGGLTGPDARASFTVRSDGVAVRGEAEIRLGAVRLHLKRFTSLAVSADGRTAIFGAIAEDGRGVTVLVEDGGEPGRSDRVRIAVGGTVYDIGPAAGGNVQVR